MVVSASSLLGVGDEYINEDSINTISSDIIDSNNISDDSSRNDHEGADEVANIIRRRAITNFNSTILDDWSLPISAIKSINKTLESYHIKVDAITLDFMLYDKFRTGSKEDLEGNRKYTIYNSEKTYDEIYSGTRKGSPVALGINHNAISCVEVDIYIIDTFNKKPVLYKTFNATS